MNKITGILGAVTAALAISCAEGFEPEVVGTTRPSFDVINGSAQALPSATGSGHTLVAGELRTFSFFAQQNPDATARGTAEINNRFIDEMFQIDVDCLKIAGNVAIVSGVITRHTDLHAVGLTGIFAVTDAGEGGHAVSDSVTQVFLFRPGTVTCQDPDPSDVRAFATPIVSGNVQVH